MLSPAWHMQANSITVLTLARQREQGHDKWTGQRELRQQLEAAKHEAALAHARAAAAQQRAAEEQQAEQLQADLVRLAEQHPETVAAALETAEAAGKARGRSGSEGGGCG